MLNHEAAGTAAWTSDNPLTNGRPACAALPTALSSDSPTMSWGCMGMRTFTGISDDRLLAAIPGTRLSAFADDLECRLPVETIVRAILPGSGNRFGVQAVLAERFRRNPLDIHGIIRLTASPLAGRDHSRSIRSASASRPSTVNGQRPSAMTTNGSAGATSVHLAGSENSSPFSSCRWTRSSPQFWRCATNSKSWPDSGWNRCVTRTRRYRSSG